MNRAVDLSKIKIVKKLGTLLYEQATQMAALYSFLPRRENRAETVKIWSDLSEIAMTDVGAAYEFCEHRRELTHEALEMALIKFTRRSLAWQKAVSSWDRASRLVRGMIMMEQRWWRILVMDGNESHHSIILDHLMPHCDKRLQTLHKLLAFYQQEEKSLQEHYAVPQMSLADEGDNG